MEIDFNMDTLLWSLVHDFIGKAYGNISAQLNDQEDLFSEARLAAIIAISKYNVRKNTKLSTWITHCVINRLKDIKRTESRRITLVFNEPRIEDGYTLAEVEFNLTMKQILTQKEYLVYYRVFVEDRSLRSVIRKEKLKEWEARKCLRRILHKYGSLVKIQDRISTRRQLQENWLEEHSSLQH